MICSVEEIKNAITHSKQLSVGENFNIKYILDSQFYESLSDTEIEYVKTKFYQLLIQQKIRGIDTQDNSTKGKQWYFKKY